MTVSTDVLFTIAGGGGNVHLMCWAAQMRVDPPDILNTLPPGPWLSQTSAEGQRSGLAFLCPNPPWVPTYPLSRGSPSPVTHTAQDLLFFFLYTSVLISLSLSLLLSLNHSNGFTFTYCYFFHLSLCLLSLFSVFATVIFGQQLSWHACRGSNPSLPPFTPAPLVFPSFSIPLALPPCPVPCRGIGGDQFTRQQLRQASFVPGLPSEKAFFASGE